MNARNKAQSLAKAKVKPCDNAGVDFRLSPKVWLRVAFKFVSTASKLLMIE
jgi:hypothetical protein